MGNKSIPDAMARRVLVVLRIGEPSSAAIIEGGSTADVCAVDALERAGVRDMVAGTTKGRGSVTLASETSSTGRGSDLRGFVGLLGTGLMERILTGEDGCSRLLCLRFKFVAPISTDGFSFDCSVNVGFGT